MTEGRIRMRHTPIVENQSLREEPLLTVEKPKDEEPKPEPQPTEVTTTTTVKPAPKDEPKDKE